MGYSFEKVLLKDLKVFQKIIAENLIKFGQIMDKNFTIINLRIYLKIMILKSIRLLMKENQLLKKDLLKL